MLLIFIITDENPGTELAGNSVLKEDEKLIYDLVNSPALESNWNKDLFIFFAEKHRTSFKPLMLQA